MSLQRFPGLIDIHVHLREPGATHKEDFHTGSRAAVAGGFTFVVDMPNNPDPTISQKALDDKINLSKKAVCDIGFHFGTNGKNLNEFEHAIKSSHIFGLKIYCNHTTGDMLVEDGDLLDEIFSAWNSDKPILVHAEGKELIKTLQLAEKYKRRLHVCHVTQAIEVELIRIAKGRGQMVTAGVTPHHLYFTKDSQFIPKGYGIMKPPLGTQKDQDALWEGLLDNTIDIVETDHAPHTKEEKEKDPAPFGVPGLETALGLMFKAVKDGKIDEGDVINFLYNNPKEIFSIPDQSDTYIELDPDLPYVVGEAGYKTKCGWSPFEGMTLYGKPQKVVVRGKDVL